MLFNLSGAHGPYFTRNIVILKDSSGNVGLGEVPGGEGSIDGQTLFGKTPYGVAMIAKKHSVPVMAFAGRIGAGVEPLYDDGFTAIIGILKGVTSLDHALVSGEENLTFAVENICRVLRVGKLPE